MTIRTSRLLLAIAIALAFSGSPVRADDDALPDRPRLENYRDYNQFLLDMAAYKKRLREAETAKAARLAQPAPIAPLAEPQVAKPAPQPVATALAPAMTAVPQTNIPNQPVSTVDPSSEQAPPPLIVNGPEDLDYAVEKAKGFPHYTYKVTRRYNRSTAQSFPLPQLQPQELESSAVGGMWISKADLPATQSDMNKDTLDQQATINEDSKLLKKKKVATKKALDENDAQMETDQLTKMLGTPVEIVFAPITIDHFSSSDGTSAVIDVSVVPAGVKTTIH